MHARAHTDWPPCIAEHDTQRTQTNWRAIPPHITHPVPQQLGTLHSSHQRKALKSHSPAASSSTNMT